MQIPMPKNEILKEVSSLLALLKKNVYDLENSLKEASELSVDTYGMAMFYKDNVYVKMSKVRGSCRQIRNFSG